MKIFRAPSDLQKPTREWFAHVVKTFELQEHHVRLLTLACRAWDRAEQARAAITKHGLTFSDRYGAPKPRPEVNIERDSRAGFARMVRELGLDLAEAESPRPPITRSKKKAR